MSNRILRTGSALSLAAIEQHCPAVFAKTPHPTRGPKYEYLPTIDPLEKLMESGWAVYEATQNKTRTLGKEGFCRHALRLRRVDQMETMNKYGGAMDGTAELVLTNAHDGTAAYTLSAGYFRLVCSNGMTTGKQIAATRITHSKGRTIGEIIDVASRIIEDDVPRMVEQIELFKASTLSEAQALHLAQAALNLRYSGDVLTPFPAKDLLKARRPVDDGLSAWSVLNRIQENVMQGGWDVKSQFTGRASKVRAVEAVGVSGKINTGIWTACEEILA